MTAEVAETLPIVLPVRFSGGGLTMQTTTSRLSVEGAFVRGVVTPKEGATIAAQFTLPATGILDARGTVTERVPPGVKGREAGFWLRFDKLGEGAKEILEQLLSERSAPGGPPKRAFSRVPTHLQVSWPTTRDFLIVYADNISAGGIFVVTDNPPELKTVVELSLRLPDNDVPARTSAEVIQRVTVQEAQRLGKKPGAGLQFVGSNDEFRRRLDLCIENLLMQPTI